MKGFILRLHRYKMTDPREDPYYNRRIRGTPFHRLRNLISFAFLGVSCLVGVGFYFLPSTQLVLNKLEEFGKKNTEEFELRRLLVQESLTGAAYRLQEQNEKEPESEN